MKKLVYGKAGFEQAVQVLYDRPAFPPEAEVSARQIIDAIRERGDDAVAEFAEKFEDKGLTLMEKLPAAPIYIKVDSRHLFRVIENLYNNISKYALEGTRVYLTMEEWVEESNNKRKVAFSVKNISAQPLTVSAEELTERFVQGDESRKTEGSGLGLSSAKNLTKSMNGDFELQLDGDLFKAILTFEVIE